MSEHEPWWSAFFAGAWGTLQVEGERFAQAAREVDFMLDMLALEPGARVLDVPCGAGRHSLELAARGYAVTGIDLNEKAIARARELAQQRDLTVHFEAADMRQLAGPSRFDAVICFFGSFGYFGDEENFTFLERVAQALEPGAPFLMDVHVTETMFPSFVARRSYWGHDQPGNLEIVEHSHWDAALGRVCTRWTFRSANDEQASVSSVRIYTYRELTELLRRAGFRSLRAVETGTGAPFRLGADRLSLIARK